MEEKKEQFTPGPWASHHNNYIGYLIVGSDGVPTLSELRNKEEVEANMRMQRAAPQMYELLKRLMYEEETTEGEYYFAGKASEIAGDAALLLDEINGNK